MKQRARTWMLIATLMLFSVVALGVSGGQPATTSTMDFCDTCTDRCRNEAFKVYSKCREEGGTQEQCWAKEDEYMYRCYTLFCPGCQSGGPCPIGQPCP